ncbi:MAG: ribosome small subunit-dependent GTPase A [Defluviitaleaceae bacterium]|nr:ribosome small subunit-dependent GTPase A [Defluviitaleaceae bacterium]
MEGIIIKGVAGKYTVRTASGLHECYARGVFRNKKITPMVGDEVIIAGEVLQQIKPRKNELLRPMVSNIDQVIVTMTKHQPAFNAGLLDRFLAAAQYAGIPALICLSKAPCPLAGGPPRGAVHDALLSASRPCSEREFCGVCEGAAAVSAEDEFLPYVMAGYKVVYASAHGGWGLDDLRAAMAGKVNVFAGPSGVGKSSLINALMPGLGLETGDISKKLGRGKHTTRHTEIFPLGDSDRAGFCVDTPGFTAIENDNIPRGEMAGLFIEFLQYLGQCKFRDCLHDKEMGCAVKAAVGEGIHPQRYASYLKMIGRG